ncbi:uncharacterized protein LOC114540129 [Dendronephthya gigantea]|uniref:uncharacterized protein LOC114540129 n=1 Tax=Dendronephthya gigantea TaxID=151771 RepID=UPI00106CDAB5|nr:uncharacterized protein LOC114540129 [Dendronephthya gigantea]XP_028416211.1 uncharacterized protein LOC114540129 [Dendronephthya gigantea]
MKIIFEVIILTSFAVSARADSYWTSWLDRDDPSASGDWELYHSFAKEEHGPPCKAGFEPVDANCRVKGSNMLWYEANQNISILNRCTPRGFACVNSETQSCKDYEIQFLCYKPPADVNIYWTHWLDRDDPSASGDWELYSGFVDRDNNPPCKAGFEPVGANCRVKSSNKPWYEANQQIRSSYRCSSTGFACVNSKTQVCEDYEIQFLCYKP